ncbi:hypothetical protein GJ744_004532 [Endocarpon pusillum]|uniref:Uncharacterized protein n=1 Tax=Endocarpon pusillum TaxID=364733 RepID=A0A8H7AWJ4_9EURO|nr:hypothetical protein GJ744_004532 [Endocarpon pusillum]
MGCGGSKDRKEAREPRYRSSGAPKWTVPTKVRFREHDSAAHPVQDTPQIDRRLPDVIPSLRVGRGRSVTPIASRPDSSPPPSPARSNRGPQHPRQQDAHSNSRQRQQTSTRHPSADGEVNRAQPSRTQVRFQTLSASEEEERRLAQANQSTLQPPTRSKSRDTSSERGSRRPAPSSDEERRLAGSLDLSRQLERDSASLFNGRQHNRVRGVEGSLAEDYHSEDYQRAEALAERLSIMSTREGRRAADSGSWQPGASSSRRQQDGASTFPQQRRSSGGTGFPHEPGCRCLVCFPENYTDGKLLRMWQETCASGCLCPRCLATKVPVPAALCCQNQGHMLPPEKRCALPQCTCKVGCYDLTCSTCYPIQLLPPGGSLVEGMVPMRERRSVRGGAQSERSSNGARQA